MIYAPRRTGFVPTTAMTRASGAVGPAPKWNAPVRIVGMPHYGQVYINGMPVNGRWEDAALTRWLVLAPEGLVDLQVVRAGDRGASLSQRIATSRYGVAQVRFVDAVGQNPVGIRPSGEVAPDAELVTIPQNERIVDPRVREAQRQMLGVGITVGPQGADGRFSVNTANGLQSFARWYNTLPEGPMLDPRDLKRGPLLTVDRTLSPEKQIALRRFAARASDVLTSIQYETRTNVVPPAPIPWGTVALVSAATGALLLGAIYVARETSKSKKAPK